MLQLQRLTARAQKGFSQAGTVERLKYVEISRGNFGRSSNTFSSQPCRSCVFCSEKWIKLFQTLVSTPFSPVLSLQTVINPHQEWWISCQQLSWPGASTTTIHSPQLFHGASPCPALCVAAARVSGAVPGKKSPWLRIGRATGVQPTASAEEDAQREDPGGPWWPCWKWDWGVPKSWGYPQIIPIYDWYTGKLTPSTSNLENLGFPGCT